MNKRLFALLSGSMLFAIVSCKSTTPAGNLTPEQTALIDSISNPRQTNFAESLKKAGSPDFCDDSGMTPLEHAVIRSDIKKMKALLAAGADPCFLDAKGYTVMHVAATIPDPAPMEYLLSAGVNHDIKSSKGKTPVMEAARIGNTAMVRRLLDHDADLKAADADGRVPLCFAAMAKEHSLDLVQLFLERGAAHDVFDKNGKTPLFHAIDAGNTKTALYLLTLLPPFDGGHAAGLGYLAMRHAISSGNLVVAENIIDKKLPLNADPSIAYRAMETVNIEGLHELLARNHVIKDGQTPIFWAALTDNSEMIELLLRRGADPTEIDNAGRRPVQYARKYHSMQILKNAAKKWDEERKAERDASSSPTVK